MQKFIRKIFGVYSGEGVHAFRFVRLAVFWALGSSCLDTISDSLFLEKVGAHSLPYVYLSIATGMICASSLVLYFLRMTSPYRILTVALGIGIIATAVSASVIGMADPPPFFWYGMKITSRIFFALMIAVSWAFTDQYHDLQDAKRLYSIYSASYFFGTILAGVSINLLFQFFGFSGLLIMASCSITYALFEARRIARKAKAVHDDSIEGIFSANRDSFASIVRLIFRSRFTIVLLLLSLFIQLLLTVTEFNYMESFERAFQGLPEGEGKIAAFLGKCRAMISFCNIIVGVFLYSRFVRRTGLNNDILVTPLFFLAVYVGWIFSDGMGLAVLGLIACDGVLFTIEDNCFNIMSNAVPAKLKSKVRIINDSFFEHSGMLLSALLLFAFQQASHWLGLILTLGALLLAITIRSIYSRAILSNLKDNALHFDRKLKNWLSTMSRKEQKEAKQDILASLKSSSQEIQLLSAGALLELGDPSVLPNILIAAKDFGTLQKIQLLKVLDNSAFSNASRILTAVSEWVKTTDSPELSKWANLYLAKKGRCPLEKPDEDIDHPDLFLRGAALLTLKKSGDRTALDRTIVSKKIELMLKSSRIDEISMALDILAEGQNPEETEKALPLLSHESIPVKRAAARCISHLASKTLSRYAPRIIEELAAARDNYFRLQLLKALGKIADSTTVKEILLASVHFRPNERRLTEAIICQMGLKIVPILLSITKDIAIAERARILACKSLGKLAVAQLKANLMDILDIEIDRAYFYFYFAHTIQTQYPLYDLDILADALMTGYHSVIDWVIHLLGAAGSIEDPELLVRALHSRNQKIHAHAVESLQKTCEHRIFRMLAPLVDDLPLEEKMAACLRWQGNYPKLTLSELLDKLEASPSLFDKVAAIRLKAKLQMPNWRQQLREQMRHSEEPLHKYAYELLETSTT